MNTLGSLKVVALVLLFVLLLREPSGSLLKEP